MSGIEFIAVMTDALAWPLVVVIGILLLRQPAAKALANGALKLLRVGPKGFEMKFFDRGVKRAEGDLLAEGQLPAVVSGRGLDRALSGESLMEEMGRLAEVSPSSVVLESFARLEQVLRAALDEPVGRTGRAILSVPAMGRLALERGLLAPGELDALREVATLRNAVAHVRAEDLDANRALAYARVVRQIMIAIRLAQGLTEAPPDEETGDGGSDPV